MKTLTLLATGAILAALFFQCWPSLIQEEPPIQAPTEVSAAATQAPTAAPTPTLAPSPTPTEIVAPTPTTAPAPPPEAEAEDWGQICQPSPEEEGEEVANMTMGSRVELEAYLYPKSFSTIRQGMMPFTLREIPYDVHNPDWGGACEIHVFIPIGTGPNQVIELPQKFQLDDVVVWDKTGREIRGWQRNLDSFHVRVVGVVVETYGADTGLGGSNTIRLEEIELLEG